MSLQDGQAEKPKLAFDAYRLIRWGWEHADLQGQETFQLEGKPLSTFTAIAGLEVELAKATGITKQVLAKANTVKGRMDTRSGKAPPSGSPQGGASARVVSGGRDNSSRFGTSGGWRRLGHYSASGSRGHGR